MLRRDLFVLYVVCTIFAEDRMRFVNLCGQIRTIASSFTIFVAFSKIAL